MENEILKLLGLEYSLQIGNYRNGEYVVRVRDSRNHAAEKILNKLGSEGAICIDLLVETIKHCIFRLEEM